MKPIKYIGLLICGMLLFNACIDDKGNYDYIPAEQFLSAEIEGLGNDTTVLKGEVLRLSPTIVNDDPSRYEYNWYIMEYQAAGFSPVKRIIGQEKDLEWTVNLDAAQYRLNFQVYDREHDVYVRHEMTVTITAAPMTTGWYVMKDNGSESDIDYISEKGERYNDVLGSFGAAIPGTAIMMAYQSTRYYHTITNEDGSVTTKRNLSAYHFLTSEDIRTYDAKDFTLYKTYEDQFYTVTEECRPQNIVFLSSDLYLINDGKIHRIYGMSSNIGKYGAAYAGIYELDNCLVPYNYGGYMVFDKTTRSFFQISSNNMTPLEEAANLTDTLALQGKDYSVICSGAYYLQSRGTIVLQDEADGQHYLLQDSRIYDPSTATNRVDWPTIGKIEAESKLCTSTCIAQSPSTFFYFLTSEDQSKVYSYVHSKGSPLETRERERLSLPGETVTYIAYIHEYKLADDETTEALAVLTSQGGNWKLRVYALKGESTSDLNTTPILEYEGTGNGRFLLYRAS